MLTLTCVGPLYSTIFKLIRNQDQTIQKSLESLYSTIFKLILTKNMMPVIILIPLYSTIFKLILVGFFKN